MIRTRRIAHTPRASALARRLAELDTPCVGCSECRGLCHELIAALIVPELVLGRGEGA